MDLALHHQPAVWFFRLGQAVSDLHFALYPDFFDKRRGKETAVSIRKRIEDQTVRLRVIISSHPDFTALKKLMSLPQQRYASAPAVQIVAAVLFKLFCQHQEARGIDGYAVQLGCLYSEEKTTGRWLARIEIASLLSRGILVMREGRLDASPTITAFITCCNPLLGCHLNDEVVRYHLAKQKADAEAKKHPQQPPPPPPVLTPQSLYAQLRQIVIGQDHACRVLATRGWLHMRRIELLKAGQRVGKNECLLFISSGSGVGKTYLAETYGSICRLPFASFSATDATSVGFVGLEIVEDSILCLLRATGSPREAATMERARLGGIIFYDEWTKKRSFGADNGRDILGSSVQAEILRLMEGSRVVLGQRKVERDALNAEFDASGLMLLFGGLVEGFEQIVRRVNRRKTSLGFNAPHGSQRDQAYIQDALVEFGMLPEFVNRLSQIVMFRNLSVDDLRRIAVSASGPLAAYNRLLEGQGVRFVLEEEAIKCMAEWALETGLMARGLRALSGAMIEEAIFTEAKGDVTLDAGEVRRAIQRVTTVEGLSYGKE